MFANWCSLVEQIETHSNSETFCFVFFQANLPFHKKKGENQKPEDEEPVHHCWVFESMWKFDNVGFSKNVGTLKYLVCADCESGPIGWHDTTVKDKFYLAADRVKYD